MHEVSGDKGDERLVIEVDEGTFPRDAVYAAAFSFLDRCYVRLDRRGEGQIAVELRPKREGWLERATAEGMLREELARQAFRLRIEGEGRAFLDSVNARAFGSAQPSGDPLGIAEGGQPS